MSRRRRSVSMIEVVAYREEWATQFEMVSAALITALTDIGNSVVEHVGSTSVPGLAAKPILDIDVVVAATEMEAAVSALEQVGYRHRGDLGVNGREAFFAPRDGIARNVYVCRDGCLAVRNHFAVRNVLRRDAQLREDYGAVKLSLSKQPGISMAEYLAGKTTVLQRILGQSDLTQEELTEIRRLNDPASETR